MSERRIKGYNLDTKHGFFGTFTLWEIMAILGAGILGSSFTSASGATPMIYSAVSGTLALLAVLISRRLLTQYPNIFKHLYAYLGRADYQHVQPEREYVPVLPDSKHRRS